MELRIALTPKQLICSRNSIGMERMSPFVSNVKRHNTRFMLRQREIISLLNQGQSQNAICSLVHCSKRSVSEVSKAARDTGKSYGELLALSDSELLTILSTQEASQVEDPRKAELAVCANQFVETINSKTTL